MNKTYLNEFHSAHNGNLVNFSGWEMPINYGSQINEHNEVRANVGVFDVSHMAVFDFLGGNQVEFLRKLLPNDVNKILNAKRALYSPLLNKNGRILDDLIVYHTGNNNFRIISNCATRQQNKLWFNENAKQFGVEVNFQENASIIAIQGPNSAKILSSLYSIDLKNFHIYQDDEVMIARTGYTGEIGFEIISNQEKGLELWNHFISKDVRPIGIAARDTLRLEAGLNLYGSDMSIDNHPYESNLGWTIDNTDTNRAYIGKESIANETNTKKLIGFYTEERGVLRAGSKVYFPGGEGVVTSGTWSPTFKKNIGFCRVDANYPAQGNALLRDKEINLHFCETNFLKHLK